MEIIFYSTHCPKCRALEMLLKKHNIKYTENNSIDDMIALGFKSAPILVVDGHPMLFADAAQWIKEH